MSLFCFDGWQEQGFRVAEVEFAFHPCQRQFQFYSVILRHAPGLLPAPVQRGYRSETERQGLRLSRRCLWGCDFARLRREFAHGTVETLREPVPFQYW